MVSCGGAQLRQLLRRGTATLPGVFNGLTARAAQQAGFEALYIGGSTVTAASGQPDIGVVGLEGFCRVIKEVHSASGMPVLVDADTGFGEEEMVTKTVFEYYSAGAAGLHMEDQVFPKRCGHLKGKRLVEVPIMLAKLQRATEARDAIQARGGDFLVCARTDARSVQGLEESIVRGVQYAEAGVDMLFPEGLRTLEEFELFAQALAPFRKGDQRLFLLANMTEFGTTDPITVSEFEQIGYDCIIFPASSLRSAMGAVTGLFAELRETGQVAGALDSMLTRQDLYKMIDYEPGEEWKFPAHKIP